MEISKTPTIMYGTDKYVQKQRKNVRLASFQSRESSYETVLSFAKRQLFC